MKKYWAYKKIDGHIQVRSYETLEQVKEIYRDYEVAKIILPFEANDIKEAAVRVGNYLEAGRFLVMEIQKNGLEIPRKYSI